MLKSALVKIGGAGFAAVVGAILVVSSVGAHQTHASSQGTLKVFTGVSGGTSAGTDITEDAAAAAAARAPSSDAGSREG